MSEIATGCEREPAKKSLMLRFTLAYTFIEAGADPKKKWIWDDFWQHATKPRNPHKAQDDYIRGTGARAALAGICRETGYSPDVAFLAYLDRARERESERES